MIAGNCGRDREEAADGGAQDQRANDCEGDLTDASVSAPATMPTSECADDAGAAVKRDHAGGQPDKKRQGVDGEREDQPAEQADPEHAEDESDEQAWW